MEDSKPLDDCDLVNNPGMRDAAGWELTSCSEGESVMLLLDETGQAFAQAHIGDMEDVDELILLLLATTCAVRSATIARLKELAEKVKADDRWID